MKAILFFDDWLVSRAQGLERRWYEPVFVKQLIDRFHPESLGYGGYYSVFFDERLGSYVMYLAVYPPEADPGTFVLRLTSADPHHWENPSFDVQASPTWKGFKNVLVHEKNDRFWPLVTRSLANTAFADWGYVATCIPADTQDQHSYLAFSKDGLHFQIDYAHPWHQARSDTWSGVTWNAKRELFQIATRPVNVDRRVATITTQDFKHFSPPETILQPDALDPLGSEIYSMPIFSYEDLFLALPHLYFTDPFETATRIKWRGRIESHLAYSYNGFNWYRPQRKAFIGTQVYGLQGGGQNYAIEMLHHDHKLLFFTSATPGEHAAYEDLQRDGKCTAGFFAPLLYEMRLDGFCSLKTSSREGILQTKSIIAKSAELTLNLRTTAHSSVRIQILDGETLEPLPGYLLEEAIPISGDHLFIRPRWQQRADLSELLGKPIRLELYLCEAEVFAIRLEHQIFIGRTPTEDL
ncbi:MAG: hypothetical protein JSV66_09050 [Trueperaceae bacterium]|nr:MAG: hypothetical protein JSV66_09050 [Trueperaceae bacterium]